MEHRAGPCLCILRPTDQWRFAQGITEAPLQPSVDTTHGKNEEDSTSRSNQCYDLAVGCFLQYTLFIYHTILSPIISIDISNKRMGVHIPCHVRLH